jgi:succinyl-CoA synthetase beta subunit
LTEDRVASLLIEAGIRVVPHVIAEDREEAGAAAQQIGFPVVMKAISSQVPHRSRIGALAIDIQSVEQLDREYTRIAEAVERVGAALERVLVQAQLAPSLEMLVGIRLDDSLGPILVVGPGGKGAEAALEEIAVTQIPVRAEEVQRLLTFHGSRFHSWLGEERIASLSAMCAQLSDWWNEVAKPLSIMELDLNPVMFDSGGPIIADALAVASEDGVG